MPKPTLKEIFEAQRDGYLARKAGEPIAHDPDGTPVYRILLGGLRWQKDITPTLRIGGRRNRYRAWDGPTRGFDVQRRHDGWAVTYRRRLHGDDVTTSTLGTYPTLREAKIFCIRFAQRLPWVPGAPH